MNPPLIKTSYVLGPKNKAIKVLLNGLSHTVIDGQPFQNVMPSFGYLSDQQIADERFKKKINEKKNNPIHGCYIHDSRPVSESGQLPGNRQL